MFVFCIVQCWFAYREHARRIKPWLAAGLLSACWAAVAQVPQPDRPAPTTPPTSAPASALSGAQATPTASEPGPTPRHWAAMPRITGRLHAADLGLVINADDPDSVLVGEYYAARRKLRPEQILRVHAPLRGTLTRQEFEVLKHRIDSHFGLATQALAFAWSQPYAVECNSLTGAMALGFDAELCSHSCGRSRASAYFGSTTIRPLLDLSWRPSMLIAAHDVAGAKALIDRGVAADGSLTRRGRPPVTAMLLTTDDAARHVRQVLYPPPGEIKPYGVVVRIAPDTELASAPRVILAITGSVHLPPQAQRTDWVAGALADHLTSTGGALQAPNGQATVLDWIAAGVTASHGTVSEPCNHLQKFPHPQMLLGSYLQGSTAIEAYWRSVAWPQQSLFVGEPLAAPFAAR